MTETPTKRGRPKGTEPQKAVLSTRVPVAQHEGICRAAAQQRMTVSAYLNAMLARVLANSRKQ